MHITCSGEARGCLGRMQSGGETPVLLARRRVHIPVDDNLVLQTSIEVTAQVGN